MAKSALRLLGISLVGTILFVCISSVLGFTKNGDGLKLAKWFLFETRRSEALQQRRIELQEVEELKLAICEKFLAGRLTLREAAEQFRGADSIVSENPNNLVADYVTPDTEREWCQQVCNWADHVIARTQSEQGTNGVRSRVEREFQELFPSDATID